MKPPQLTALATCKLCGRAFSGPRAIVLTGEPNLSAATRIAQYGAQLKQHIEDTHPEDWQQIQLASWEYQGLLMYSMFETTDQALKKQQDLCRWHIHQRTLTASISDDAIKEKARELAAAAVDLSKANLLLEPTEPAHVAVVTPKLIEAIAAALEPSLRELRDKLQEPNRYPAAKVLLHTTK